MAPLKALVLSVGCIAGLAASAQNIQLKRAKSFTVEQSGGRSVTKLRGNVVLQSPEGVFTCDSADWFRNESRFFAYANVRFQGKDGMTVRSRTLEHLNGENYFAGGVTVVDGDQRLETASLRYSTQSRKGQFSQPATVTTRDGRLTCRRGEFSGATYRFLGSVHWLGSEERVHSEVMEYDADARTARFPQGGTAVTDGDSVAFGQGRAQLQGNRYLQLRGGVQGWGSARSFTAEQLERWTDLDRTRWTGSAHLTDWEKDSTEIWAEVLTITPDSLTARDQAAVRMPSWSGKAEMWRGHRTDSVYVLEGNPVIWSGPYQILAEYFTLMQRGPGDSLWAQGGVHLGEEADSAGRSNQMAAEALQAQLRGRHVARMELETNAQALYYPGSTGDGPVSRMKSARIVLRFADDGTVDTVEFLPSSNGSTAREDAPSYLPGYLDRWGERPSSTDAMSGRK